MERKIFGIIGLVALFMMVCSPMSAIAAENVLRLNTASPGGSWYPMGVAMSSIWEKKIPGLKVPSKPGGGVANVMAVVQDMADVGISTSVSVGDQIAGNPPFKKASSRMRTLASFYPSYYVIIVWKNSDIMTVSDLKGKRIAPGKKGYTSESLTAAILKAKGLSYKDLKKVEFVSDNNAVDLMKDGHIDAFCDINSSLKDPSTVDLAITRQIRMLPMTDDIFDQLAKTAAGLYQAIIPAGSYNGVDQDVPTISSRLGLIVNPDLSDDLVYNLAKSLAENWVSDMHPVSKSLANVQPQELAQELGCPLHPGAAKYYKERGWIK